MAGTFRVGGGSNGSGKVLGASCYYTDELVLPMTVYNGRTIVTGSLPVAAKS